MHEITFPTMLAWLVGSAIAYAGISWGVIRHQVREMTKGLKCMEHRIGTVEQTYVRNKECADKRAECEKDREYHENVLLDKMSEIKILMSDMDRRREDTRQELSVALKEIQKELSDIQRRWPEAGK